MKPTVVLLLCLASAPPALAAPSDAQAPHAPALAAPTPAGEDYYFASVASIRPGDLDSLESIDFARLRRGYFEATEGTRLPPLDPDAEKKLGAAFAAEQWEEVVKLSDAILAVNFTRIRAHVLGGYALSQLGRDGSFHFAAAARLIQSILATGDGLSFDTAYHVFFIEEEYDILRHLQLRSSNQELIEAKGRSYDVLTAQGAEGAPRTLYFDVTEHMRQLEKIFK